MKNNYIEHLYNDTTDGHIVIMTINKNESIKIYNTDNIALREVVTELQGEENTFIAPNTYFIPRRGVKYIRQFRAFYIDFDELKYSKIETAYEIFWLAEEGKIPRPTMVVDSGRGIHVYWRIKNAPYGALNTWQELEDMIYHKVKHLGADRKATDAARVLRLPGTINTRNNVVCKVMYQDNTLEYSMHDLREKYLNDRYKKQISKAKKKSSNIIENAFFNSYSLHLARLQDLEVLCDLRRYNVKGYRNMIIHCYAYWLGIYERDTEVLQCRVQEINSKFIEPLKDNEVKSIIKSVDKAVEKFIDYEQEVRAGKDKRVTKGMRDKAGYWYKNETLIERLDITEAEQRKLKTIIGTRVKYDRKNKKRNDKRRNENGLTNKQQELEDFKIQIKQLKEQGINNCKIAEILKTNESKIRRLSK